MGNQLQHICICLVSVSVSGGLVSVSGGLVSVSVSNALVSVLVLVSDFQVSTTTLTMARCVCVIVYMVGTLIIISWYNTDIS